MSDEERDSISTQLAVVSTQVAEIREGNGRRMGILGAVLGVMLLQLCSTFFFSGVKWGQVDRLIADTHELTQDVRSLDKQVEQLKHNAPKSEGN
jgi:cell division protein FtsB